MKSVKHILIFTPGFAQDEDDYLCIPPLQAYLPALRAARPDLRISIVTLHYPFEEGVYRWRGFSVHALAGSNVRNPLRKFQLWRKARKKLRAIHKENPVDVIHSLWLHECTWIGQQIARKLSIPLVATVQGQDALQGNRYISNLDLHQIRVVTLSHRAAQTLRSFRPVPNIEVIPWGLPPEDIGEGGEETKDYDILGVGSLVPVKNWSRFLEVIEQLRRDQPFLKACLIGEGAKRADLEAEAERRGLTGVVEFAGEVPRKKVLSMMGRSKVLLHTANYEGQGYIFVEALAQGMRIVSTPVGMARAGKRWSLGESPEELSLAVQKALAEPAPEGSGQVDRIEDTVAAYLEVYES